MKTMQIVIEGVSEEEIQKAIERNTKGWWLFFEEPRGANYKFFSPFWGYHWDGTPENLKEIVFRGARVKDKVKQHICIFKYNGEDRFVWCSWTKEVCDLNTIRYYKLEGNDLARKITDVMISTLGKNFINC